MKHLTVYGLGVARGAVAMMAIMGTVIFAFLYVGVGMGVGAAVAAGVAVMAAWIAVLALIFTLFSWALVRHHNRHVQDPDKKLRVWQTDPCFRPENYQPEDRAA